MGRIAPRPGMPRPHIFAGARAGYISFQVIAKLGAPGEYSLEWTAPAGLQVDMFREWYHALDKDKSYVPDALVPGQDAVPFAAARAGQPHRRSEGAGILGRRLDSRRRPCRRIPARVSTEFERGRRPSYSAYPRAGRMVPSEDAVTIDHNSYGSSWIGDLYPQARDRAGGDFYRSDAFFKLIHAYHRLFYEHRGVFHQLGYGHGGKVGPEFAPALEGSGRNRHITNWELFDRHYGPLFDGIRIRRHTARSEADSLRVPPDQPGLARIVPLVGRAGYEAEFVNVVSAMERHFREKNWTRTRLELFFNHKKRYMGFPWDGDEERFPGDLPYFREYGRLLRKAVPADSPVKFVFRADVSWDMERQSKELAGHREHVDLRRRNSELVSGSGAVDEAAGRHRLVLFRAAGR